MITSHQRPNPAAPPNRRPRFAFAALQKLDYPFCAQPASSAAVGEPQRSADVHEFFGIRPRPSCRSKKSIMKLLVLGIVTAAVLTLATGCCTHPKAVAWEYRVVQGATHQPDLEQKLNEAGKEGFAVL